MAEREGQQFGNYRLTRLLGKGAFAEVYLAVQIYLGTEAAIKVLHTQLASAADVEKFRLEARTIATLVHPHIVRVLDFGVQDGTPYLLMDYAPNGSLRQLFPADTPLAPAMILPYLKQIADGLQYAHDQRLVHRDIKPENMLLGRNNEALLSDFGIATAASSSQGTQEVAGTAAYMAPEQLQGHPRPASDQYSLGVVVYEWLAGERPFRGTFTEIASQHVLAPPPPLRQKVPTLAPAIEQVVLTALEKDPKQRFGSVRAFATALEQAIQGDAGQTYATRMQAPPAPMGPAPAGAPGSPNTALYSSPTVSSAPASPASGPAGPAIYSATTIISGPGAAPPVPPILDPALASGPPGGYNPPPAVPGGPPVYPAANAGWGAQATPAPSYEAPTFGTSIPGASPSAPTPGEPPSKGGISRRTILITGAAGLVMLGSGGALLLLSQRSGGGPQTNASATSTTGTGPTNTAATGATSTGAATDTATATDTPTETATPAPQPGDRVYLYQGHTNVVDALAWSPSSQRLASASFDDTVQVWDALTGRNAFAYRGHTDQVWTVAGAPNGSMLASGGRDKTVQVWNAMNGSLISNYTGHDAEIAGVAWSPDSTMIASASYDNTVRVWVATSQQFIQTYMGHTDHVWAVAWSPDGSKIASGSKDKTVQVWDAVTGTTLYTYTGHSGGVTSVAWSSNGQRIASGSDDGTAQVWDALTGNNPVVYQGHSGGVTSVVWSPDRSKLASASKDTTVQVWRANGMMLLVYRKHGNVVDDVRWSPSSKYLASASADKTVQVWLAP